ncbi:DUF1992 domain-containing protein [Arthrobacter sp. CAU 1506]|uniref:DnaJ family domain-containing protein n=1 Tax=Arthrobacter sp. CAU 1506 TaxID=2560052 RepID=UPI0010AC9561|nr:DUF1992 domain-containing protein [Arthrobacter sp. CAU 1506]TJY70428.1 DUF1992 domain-containing protein [Arthrobacter sp. CAU 1506]
MGRAAEDNSRRWERAAELRAAREQGQASPEDEELTAAEEEKQRKIREMDASRRADYLVREAMARGEFDDLKYAGKPIPNLGNGYDPDWWLKGLIEREHLTGLGPEALLLRTEDAELDGRLDQQVAERQVREILEDFNARVVNARRQLQGGPPVITKTRDLEYEVERWRERRAVRAEAEAEESPEPEPKRRWWRRMWDVTE